ncbi:hypothetical protein K438DRAFT_1770791 [Mycena galopus ATCC 62051]|nr:hypothetical protein K438DRAFT_1770791 [Mycena galopus ATCC 62051]
MFFEYQNLLDRGKIGEDQGDKAEMFDCQLRRCGVNDTGDKSSKYKFDLDSPYGKKYQWQDFQIFCTRSAVKMHNWAELRSPHLRFHIISEINARKVLEIKLCTQNEGLDCAVLKPEMRVQNHVQFAAELSQILVLCELLNAAEKRQANTAEANRSGCCPNHSTEISRVWAQ